MSRSCRASVGDIIGSSVVASPMIDEQWSPSMNIELRNAYAQFRRLGPKIGILHRINAFPLRQVFFTRLENYHTDTDAEAVTIFFEALNKKIADGDQILPLADQNKTIILGPHFFQ